MPDPPYTAPLLTLYPPPTWFQQHVGMWFVQMGWRIRYGQVWRGWLDWWGAFIYSSLVACIPRRVKERIKRGIRGW